MLSSAHDTDAREEVEAVSRGVDGFNALRGVEVLRLWLLSLSSVAAIAAVAVRGS